MDKWKTEQALKHKFIVKNITYHPVISGKGDCLMDCTIRVFIESKSTTIQAADMDTIGHPYCTGTNTTDWATSAGKAGNVIPQEHLILVDAASRAAQKIGCQVEVIDMSNYSFWQKRKSKGVIPRIEIEGQILTGLPTSDEIVAFVEQSPIAN